MAALDERADPDNWAESLARKLSQHSDYLDANAGRLSSVELEHIEHLANAITRILSDHEERKIIINH